MAISQEIPILDYRMLQSDPAQFVQDLKDAASHWGFFFLRNHPVPQSEIDENFALARTFFAEGDPGPEYKIGAFAVGYSGRWREGYGKDDHISFNLSGRYRLPMNLPPILAEQYDRLQEFKMTVYNLAVELSRGFAVALGLDEDHFSKWHEFTKNARWQNMNLRLLYYPENLNPKEGESRIREHSDMSSLTILFQDQVGGLEVLSPTGEWVTAPVIPGAPLINIGDMLEIWSGGELKSTVHRLTFENSHKERYSLPCFIGPNPDAVLEPIKGKGVQVTCSIEGMTAGEFCRRRVNFLHHGGDPAETPFIVRDAGGYRDEGMALRR